jgi:AraC-like DNA-binding protein
MFAGLYVEHGEPVCGNMKQVRDQSGPPSSRRPHGDPRLCSVCHEVFPSRWSRDACAQTAYRLVVIVDGRLVLKTETEQLTLSSGEAVLIPPDTACGELVAGNDEMQRLLVTFEWNGGEILPLQVLRDGAGRLRELTQWLIVERHAQFKGAEAYRRNVLSLVVGECQRLSTDSTGALEKRIRAFVLEHMGQPISLEVLAKHIGMGRYHLCRKLRTSTGQSPMCIVRSIRLELARELIRCTQLSLREVATRVGLQNEQHLSRLLRAHFGVGVRELRQGVVPNTRPILRPKEPA